VSAGAARRGVSSPLGPRSAPTSWNTPRNMKEPCFTALRAAAAALYPVSAFATARTARPLRCSASVRGYPSQVFILAHLPVRARPARAPSPAPTPPAAPGQRRPRNPQGAPGPRAGAARTRAPVAPARPRPARPAAAPPRPAAPRAAAADRRCAPSTYAPAPPHGSARALTGPPHFLSGPPRDLLPGWRARRGAGREREGLPCGDAGRGKERARHPPPPPISLRFPLPYVWRPRPLRLLHGQAGAGAPREKARLPRGVVQPPRKDRGADARVGSEWLQRRGVRRRLALGAWS